MKYMRVEAICTLIALIISLFLLLSSTVDGQDTCFQRADPGNCRGAIPRFFFDSRSGRCNTFLYGGCGGNRNNFNDLGSCNSFRNYCLRRRGF